MNEAGMKAWQVQRTDRWALRGSWLRPFLLSLTCLIVAGVGEPSVASTAEVVAVRAEDFLNSLGVCSAVSCRGESLARTVEAARYLRGPVGVTSS
jgi:hypothetical protein